MSNKEALIKKYGSEEAYIEFLARIGQKGGRKKVPKGFALVDIKRRKVWSSRGGKVGKNK